MMGHGVSYYKLNLIKLHANLNKLKNLLDDC